MKRAALVLAAAMVLGAVTPAGARPVNPGAFAGADQEAMAWWIQMKGDRGTAYVAEAFRYVDDSGLKTMGFVAKGKCFREKSPGFVITMCMANGFGKELSIDEFQMDPALQSASMSLKKGRFTHTVDWTGDGIPSIGQGAEAGEWGAGAGAGAGNSAKAEGKLYGKKLSKGCQICFLIEGGGASVFTTTTADERRTFEIVRKGDRFFATAVIKRRI